MNHEPKGEDYQAHLLFLERLDRINRAIQGAKDLEQMMRDVLDTVCSIFDCDRAWLVYACDPSASSFRVPMEITKTEYPGAKSLNVEIPMSADVAHDLQEALDSNAPVVYIAGTDRPINKVTAEQFGVQSQMLIAIYPKSGKPWAFGMHQCSYARVWTTEEKWLFQEISRRMADGLTSLLMYKDLQDRETELRRAMVEIQNLMRNIPEVLYVLDTDNNIIKWNRKAESASGYSAEELSRKLVFELIPEHDRPLMITMVNDAYLNGYAEMRSSLIRKDNTVAPYRWSAAPLNDEKGNNSGIIGIGWDLSEQIAKEEAVQLYQTRQRAILNTIPDIVWMKDSDGVYLTANEAFLTFIAKQQDEVIGKTDFDFWPKEYADKYRSDDVAVIESRLQKRTIEAMVNKNGDTIQVETIKTPVYGESGVLIGIAGVARDITNREKHA